MNVVDMPLESIIPYVRNPRVNDGAVAAVADSIREFGVQQPIVVDAKSVVVVGHTRLLAARQLGLSSFPVVVAEGLSEAQAKAYRIADNRVGELAEWDSELLRLEIGDLGEMDFDLDLLGFGEEIGDWLGGDDEPGTEGDTEPEIDRAEELREKWGVETGQLWRLGDHLLLCGDSTDRDDVSTVNGGSKADVCLTDPPYGLGDTKSDKNNYDTISDSKDGLVRLIAGFMPLAKLTSNIVVITPGNTNQSLYDTPTWIMAWFTPAGVGLGPWGFCCWQPILCYGEDPKLSKGLGSHPDALVHTESSENLGHPCTKPIRFWEWLVERVSENGDAIYDPFSGSGTTIIACENLKRKCRAIEISPAYVAIAIQRWADHTGREPELM